MKLSKLTARQVDEAAGLVQREVRQARNSAIAGNRQGAYAAAERAEQAAHEFKLLFGLEPDELAAVKTTGFTNHSQTDCWCGQEHEYV